MALDIIQIKNIVAHACDTILLPLYHSVSRQYKPDGSIVTHADIQLQAAIKTQLQQAYPDIPLLGEEMDSDTQQQLIDSGDAIWCLDPIDGTSNFASGLPFFCVSLALIEQGHVTFGLIYDPIRQECFYAQSGHGAWLNQDRLHIQSTGMLCQQAIAFIDFKRLDPQLACLLIQDRPYASQRSLGSIALELCWLAAGRGHLYLHGQQHLWDIAAAQLILSETGAHYCTLKGQDLKIHLPPQSMLAASDAALFAQWAHYLNVPLP